MPAFESGRQAEWESGLFSAFRKGLKAKGHILGKLDDEVRKLEWCPDLPPNYLYYAGRRHLPPALRAFIDAMRSSSPAWGP